MAKCYLVMYTIEETREQGSEEKVELPNAFVIESSKKLTQRMIVQNFPWKRLPEGSPRKMRFGLRAGGELYWLDLKDEEQIPFFSKDIVFIKLWE